MRSIVKAIIRIVLIFLFLESVFLLIRYGGSIWSSNATSEDWDYFKYLLIYIGAEVVIVLILWVLWWKTDWIVRLLVREAPDDSLAITTSNLDFFIVAIRVLGIFFIISAVSEIIGDLLYYSTYDRIIPDADKSWLLTVLVKDLSTHGAILVFGLILSFVGTKIFNPLVNLWNTGSLSEKPPDSEKP